MSNDGVEPRHNRREVKAQSFLASARTTCWAASSLDAETFDAARTTQIEQHRAGRPQARCDPERHILGAAVGEATRGTEPPD
jgi:hypothetical protein